MGVFRRDGRWVIEWKDGAGKGRQRRTQCSTKLEARALLTALQRKSEYQRLGIESIDAPTRLAFGELLDWYWENFGSELRSDGDRQSAEKHLRPALGQFTLSEITSARIDEVLSALADSLAPKSLNNLRGFVRTVFVKAAQRGLWSGLNPAIAVPRRKVPRRVASYLKPAEVTLMLREVAECWRPMFACAVYTGMRRGELVALRKADVDLEAGSLLVAHSWGADTTKGGRAAVLPIHPELRPYLAEAIRRSTSALVFPRADGSMHREHIDLADILRAAMNRAGLVDGWVLKCRRKGCGHSEASADSEVRPCPRCDFKLWPSPVPRRTRFHDLRHTTATLMLKAGVPLAVVQRVLRHSSPTITAEVYGHLDLEDMRSGIETLTFEAPALPVAEVLSMAANAESTAPALRNSGEHKSEGARATAVSQSPCAVESSGPSWIRTRDQSVMSRQL